MADEDEIPTQEMFPYALIDANGNVETVLLMTDDFADVERVRLQAVGYADLVKVNEGDRATPGAPLMSEDQAFFQDSIAKINAEAASRIEKGFEWPAGSGLFLSLSIHGQAKINEAYSVRDMLRYPLRWMTVDDKAFIIVQNAGELAQLTAAMVATVQEILRSATDAKIVLIAPKPEPT